MTDTMNPFVRHGARWALLLPLACNGLPPEQTHAAPGAMTSWSDRQALALARGTMQNDGVGRRVDADGGSDGLCELGLCVAPGSTRDPHGCCISASGESESPSGSPVLVERFTVLGFGEDTARTTLRNEGTGVLKYRLATECPALGIDSSPAELAPGEEADLRADVGSPAATERPLPVHVITTGGSLLWSIEIEAAPRQTNTSDR